MEGRGRGIEKIGEREENWRRERQRKGGKWNDREREEGRRRGGKKESREEWRAWVITLHRLLADLASY